MNGSAAPAGQDIGGGGENGFPVSGRGVFVVAHRIPETLRLTFFRNSPGRGA